MKHCPLSTICFAATEKPPATSRFPPLPYLTLSTPVDCLNADQVQAFF